ncbi:hypothetical protein G6F38_004076 [Rhizopus arrhizus]|nr:hypothetical protein G6F38_004076 [Rhizopus arrhizus]
MSIGPHRTSYGFSTIPSTSNPLSRQHMMNAPAFQQVMTLVPSPNPSLSTQTNAKNNSSSNSSNNAALSRHSRAGGNAQTEYCDNCQTFRHISFFQEKDFKYNICRLCNEREMQRSMANKERYEQYEEQQKSLKHNRYPISPYSQQQQQQHQQQQHQQQRQQTTTSSAYTPNQTSPLFPGSSASSPPQTSSQLSLQLPQMPITLGGNNPANLPPPPNLATPNNSNNSNNPSPQLNASSSSMMLGMNINNSKSHLFPVNNSNRNDHHQQQQIHMHQIIQPPLPLPQRSKATTRLSSTSSSSAVNVDLISLDEFVEELKKHVDFDRKLYHLDIQPLIEGMGSSAGFSQLGRGICEKVLEGTRFNFSLKDRRKSTKSPDTLSTLRYYCSQRSDTAKPRKAEHPKAQLKYNCAGALTIIIDLSKKSAHVTVIHKHAHPPFISHHHQSKSTLTTPAIQRTRPPPPPPPQPDQQDQRQLRMIKQQQIHQRFDALRQRLSDMDRLLESQRQYANEDFLSVANEALSDVSEMVQACKTVDSSGVIYPPNKYTLHYNKRGDLL